MMQRIQLSITDGEYAAAVREALSRSCAWHVDSVDRPDLSQQCVLVLDEAAFDRLPLPLTYPGRIVLICRQDPQVLAQAWDAGIVSVVSQDAPLNTVMLAVMAAALRVAKGHSGASSGGAGTSEISPTAASAAAPIPPENRTSGSKRIKIH